MALQVFDDWTFYGNRTMLQASIGPVITSLVPDSGKGKRNPQLEEEGVQLILQILTNHATHCLMLQMLLMDRPEASASTKGAQNQLLWSLRM